MRIVRFLRLSLMAAAVALAVRPGAWAANACSQDPSGKRCILWNIAHHCLDASISDYCNVCPTPLEESSCPVQQACRKQLQVW